MDTTAGGFLTSHFKGRKGFGGVFANDALQSQQIAPGILPKKVYILNLQNSDEPGCHWTLLYNGTYYDSYGVPPTKAINPFVHSYTQVTTKGLTLKPVATSVCMSPTICWPNAIHIWA